MARRRSRDTHDILEEALDRLGIRLGDVPLDRVVGALGLPAVDGHADDDALARTVRELRARSAFARDGAPALRKAMPELVPNEGRDGSLSWQLKVRLPLAEGGRLDMRIKVPADGRMEAILGRMAGRNDPSHGLESLRAAAADLAARTVSAHAKLVGRLRNDLARDLRSLGADAPGYVADLEQALRSRELAVGPTFPQAAEQQFKHLRAKARQTAAEDSRMRSLRDNAGFGAYIDRFAPARRTGRRIVFHMGPTNSGKTYAALRILAKAPTGAYLAPLRLLALENFETLRDMGLRAGMVTGEEVLGEPDATHLSRTIETADLMRPVAVAVIDEIQMLTDPDRGWAWTNALFGIPADVVVLCGADDALPYVRRAAEAAGESLEVVEFERKTPLRLQEEPVPVEEAEPGDAIVAFSRRSVHEHRETLVSLGRSVAVIYGALSPEVRRAEAARFREGEAEVLVTTDAVGMGLNLGPLKRVVFTTARKYDGRADRPLTNPEIRQIAGRAGRFGHQDVGYVAVSEAVDLPAVRDALSGAPALPAADQRFYVRPDIQAIRAVASELGTDRLGDVLAHFARATFYEGSPFQPCSLEDAMEVARIVDKASLPIEERFAFSICPLDRRDEVSMAVLARWAQLRARGEAVPAPRPPLSRDLAEQERAVRIAGAYLWLSRRFRDAFADVEAARTMRTGANAAIEDHLRTTATRRARRRAAERPYGAGTGTRG